MPVLWIGASAVGHVETSRRETLKKTFLQMPGKGSSGWTSDASVPGAFSTERWLALLPDCVENLLN